MWRCASALDRETGAAAAGRRGVRIDHAERGADQVIDEIDLGPGQKRHRCRVDQHDGTVAGDYKVVYGPIMFDVEFILEAGAAAALDADPQHGAVALLLEDFANAARSPLADSDGRGHAKKSPNPAVANFKSKTSAKSCICKCPS